MSAAPIPGDRFVRTLTHYLDSNQARLRHAGRDEARSSTSTSSRSRPTTSTSTSTSTPASLYGLAAPYMSLLGAATPQGAVKTTSYMPARAATLALDMHHLFFLLVQFDHVGLDIGDPARLGTIPADGVVQEGDGSAGEDETRSIMSVSSIASTLSLTTGWNFWQRQWAALADQQQQHPAPHQQQQQQPRTVLQDVEHIYEVFERVAALRLQMRNTRVIQAYEAPLAPDAVLTLLPFKRVRHLELANVHPRMVAEMPTQTLTTLVVRGANLEDAAEALTEHGDWSQLRMLSLAENNLITLDDAVALRVHETLTHLDLSSNQLGDVPHALRLLYNLQSLQLANNVLTSLNGINTVLGNVQELDLRGNRIAMLVGLDRLLALERLDLRDNQIDDWAELTRLTALPNLEDVWVAGNPLVDRNPNYRTDIFAAFRQHADHDIQLDGSRPSFAERRRIQDTPAAKLRQQDNPPSPVVVHPKQPAKVARARSKRFVKLGRQHDDTPPPPVPPLPPTAAAAAPHDDDDPATRARVHRAADLDDVVAANITRRKSVSSSTRRSSTSRRNSRHSRSPSGGTVADDDQQQAHNRHRSVSPTLRRKIASIRQEAGTEWLRVWQEMDLGKAVPNKDKV